MITQIISVYNVGTGSIKDLHVTPPEKLPWITLTTSGTDLILPMGKGLSIRDENARAIIAVNILPNEYVRPGIYEDVITLTSNAGTKTIPVKINVGAAHVGTITLEAVDSNYAPVEDAKITLIGPQHLIGSSRWMKKCIREWLQAKEYSDLKISLRVYTP